jgi:hypothetical protein
MPTLRAVELKSSFSSLEKYSIVIKHRETSYKMSGSMYLFLFLFWSGLLKDHSLTRLTLEIDKLRT